ncbi:IS431 transposase [Staphylococcus aureus]|nr:IS431 transposase [Staphylococcus aureus]SCS88753.1 IS431 transposase [Staphylococcus aureus]SCS99280.1 IS431 transposase [Staphylococcus aureus]
MNYFRYKQFDKDVITVAVGYYLRYALSYRDISEILRERAIYVHHSTRYRNMLLFCIKFGRKRISKLIINGI